MTHQLADLAQLLQIANMAQQPQLEQQRLQQGQHAEQIAAALHILGMQQSQGQVDARLGFEREQAQQTAAHQSAQEQHQSAMEQHGNDMNERLMKMGVLKDLVSATSTGQPLNPLLRTAISQIYPELGQQLDAQDSQHAADLFNQNKDAYSKVYDPNKPAAASMMATVGRYPADTVNWLNEYAQQQHANQPPHRSAWDWVKGLMPGQGSSGTQSAGQAPTQTAPLPPPQQFTQNYDASGNPTNTIPVPQAPLAPLVNTPLFNLGNMLQGGVLDGSSFQKWLLQHNPNPQS